MAARALTDGPVVKMTAGKDGRRTMDFSGPAVCDFKVLSQAFGFELVVFVPPLRFRRYGCAFLSFFSLLRRRASYKYAFLRRRASYKYSFLRRRASYKYVCPCMGTGL